MGLLASLAERYPYEYMTSGPDLTEVLHMDQAKLCDYYATTSTLPSGEANVHKHVQDTGNGLGRVTAIAVRMPKPKKDVVFGVRRKSVSAFPFFSCLFFPDPDVLLCRCISSLNLQSLVN